MKVFMMKQATPEWWEVKRGIPSSSDFDRIITPAKGDLSESAVKYIAQLIGDVFCPTANYFSEHGPVRGDAAENGVDTEPEARNWLALDAGLVVEEVGFVVADDFSMGASPDGVLGFDFAGEADPEPWRGQPYFQVKKLEATVELKCPKRSTHTEYLLEGKLPTKYKPQVHGHMVVTGAASVEFVSYARGLPPLRVKVERDSYTDKVEKAVNEFVGLYKAALEKVRQR